jgi:trans-aconitate methyltransferase
MNHPLYKKDIAMMRPTRVQSFASDSPEYHQAFKAFLVHTDQKEKALGWLSDEVAKLRNRNVMIDAGAGNGKLTTWFIPRFQQIVAIEPNPSLEAALRESCPTIRVLPTTITAAIPSVEADFVLCSHVFYYIPRSEWEANVERIISWLAPGGVLAIALQNPETDCMHMLKHFTGERFDLGELCRLAQSRSRDQFAVRIETVPAYIQTDDLATACTIAEFMLNLLPLPNPPTWDVLERYVIENYRQTEGGYRFSCHQDFLRVERSS